MSRENKDKKTSRKRELDVARDEIARLRKESAEQEKLISELRTDLDKSENIFEAIVETTDNGIMIEDENGYVAFANRGLEKLSGCNSRDEILNRPWSDFFFMEQDRKVEGETGVYESFLVRRDGSRLPVLVSSTSFYFRKQYVGVLSIIKDVREQKEAEAALRESESRLRALSHRMMQTQEEERAWLARELHDELGQQLAAIQLVLLWLKKKPDPGPGDIETLEEKIEGLTREVKKVTRGLSPTRIDTLGLRGAVEDLAPEFDPMAVSLDISEFDDSSLDSRTAVNAYRIIQEALSNAAKHSGARFARAGLSLSDGRLEISVEDDGCGFDPSDTGSGFGITGMKERAALCGGSFNIESGPGGGTRISVSMPANKKEDAS